MIEKHIGLIMALWAFIAMCCLIIGYNACMITHMPHELSEPEKRRIAINFMCAPEHHWKNMESFCGQYALDSKKE